ncbi:WYL domain-containing protein [Cutibacterium acnes]|jgi:hypothetical protein|nr:WYL domain-containing protein [Cutibacterium acnes]QAZ49534.1 WYL domain-containing protein [Cutibacterium acnes DSM 1897]MBS5257385.1 WYL domain-containing protein [Cutibacterium acnes]MCD1061816.1 WYL domain-containing protein [Cutibacterium acnes]MCD1088830.1 WYL domain-containing protein [Cutibacterium acnes]
MTAVATRGQVLGTPPLSEVLLIDPSGWFTTGKELGLLTAARERRRIRLCYRRSGETSGQWLTADPYGLVNKAGSWYLVADVDGHPPACSTPAVSKSAIPSRMSRCSDQTKTCGRYGTTW